eukprot:2439836-Pyramimonas_sp.AAC.2
MAIQIKGEGKEADRALYHFYDEWMRVTLEMEKQGLQALDTEPFVQADDEVPLHDDDSCNV